MSDPAIQEALDTDAIEPVDVEQMVAAIAPTWSVERIRPSKEASDAVFFLTVETPDGPREVVLKAFAGEVVAASAARSEPRVLELLADETSIPVPAVVGYVDDHPDLPAPFFLTERLPGENGSGEFEDLSTDALEEVLADAGSHLAELHDVRSFDQFGRIGVEEDETGGGADETGGRADKTGGGGDETVVAGDELAVIGDEVHPQDRWTDWLLADAEDTLDGMEGGRFDDLVAPLREYVREAIPSLDAPDSAVLVHWDYRLGNLLLDPETDETTGVLDWADLVAGDPVYNLATVEDHNINWQTRDVVRRKRLREQFRAAYHAQRSGDRSVDNPDDDFHDRKRVYHLCNRLNAMACLPDWYAGADDAVRDERAAEHRMFVREYLE